MAYEARRCCTARVAARPYALNADRGQSWLRIEERSLAHRPVVKATCQVRYDHIALGLAQTPSQSPLRQANTTRLAVYLRQVYGISFPILSTICIAISSTVGITDAMFVAACLSPAAVIWINDLFGWGLAAVSTNCCA